MLNEHDLLKERFRAEQLEIALNNRGYRLEFAPQQCTILLTPLGIIEYIMERFIDDLNITESNLWVDIDRLNTIPGKISGIMIDIIATIIVFIIRIIKRIFSMIPLILTSFMFLSLKDGYQGLVGITSKELAIYLKMSLKGTLFLMISYYIIMQTYTLFKNIRESIKFKQKKEEIAVRNNIKIREYLKDIQFVNRYKQLVYLVIERYNIQGKLTDVERQIITEQAVDTIESTIKDMNLAVKGIITLEETTLRDELTLRISRINKTINSNKQGGYEE